MKNMSTFLKTAILLPALFCLPGLGAAQILSIPLITGYEVKINGLDPTVCQPSSAKIALTSSFLNLQPSTITPAMLSSNGETYHLATAGKMTMLIVDIPAVGNLPAYNGGLSYIYGKLGDPNAQGGALVPQANNPPAGYIRFQLPITFPLGQNQSYVAFLVNDAVGNPPNPYASLFVIPYYVLGPTHADVAILGTTVQPQLPFMILHAPPGDGSSSEFQEGKTTCREFEETYATDNSNSANLAVKLGVAGSLGFIATVNFEFSVTFSGGVTAGDLAINTSSNQTCVTVNQGFSTTELTGPDGGGDVFIGYGTDLNYGVYEYWKLNQSACNISLDTGLIYSPTGTPRKFAYTKSAILNEIANLQATVADSTLVSAKTANDAQNQIDVWNQVLALNDANINNPNNVAIGTADFSAGVSQFQESSITVTETNSIQVEHYLEGTVGVEAVIEVGGSGVTGGYEYKSSERYGKTQNQSAESSKLVKFTLADNDSGVNGAPGDIFKLDVVRDPMFGTPVFRIRNGTRSSCPYQGGYQRDQPNLNHDGSIGEHIVSQGNPLGGTATFLIDICNESNETRSYLLKLDAGSNPNNAEVRVAGALLNGNDLGQLFSVGANTCLENYEVSVKQATQLSYPDLRLFLYPECNEDDIESSIFASVYFGNASAVHDLTDNRLLAVSPNPTSGMVQIGLPQGKTMEAIRVTDFSGKLVRTIELNSAVSSFDLDLSHLPKGVYGVQARAAGQVYVKKLVVQ